MTAADVLRVDDMRPVLAAIRERGVRVDPLFAGECRQLFGNVGTRLRYCRKAGRTIDEVGELLWDRFVSRQSARSRTWSASTHCRKRFWSVQYEPLFDDPIYLDEYGNPGECSSCDDGLILACPDDVCQGLGECIHGDGYIVCPECNGASAL